MVVVIIMLLILLSLIAAYSLFGKTETASTQAATTSNTGFYAAEAGLNMRAKQIQDKFQGYNRPLGTSPGTSANAWQNCIDASNANDGSDDFACNTISNFNGQKLVTYVVENPTNEATYPISINIPTTEPFGGLSAQEYRYDVTSVALNSQNLPSAILTMRFKSRLVPMFQFLAFYNKDLEISHPPNMNLTGNMHANGNIYFDAFSPYKLIINGKVSATGTLYSGKKYSSDCYGSVYIYDPSNQRQLSCGSGTRTAYPNSALTSWNNQIVTGINSLTVPPPESFNPTPGATYWNKADLRVVLKLDSSGNPTNIEVRDQYNNVNNTATNNLLNVCPSSVTTLTSSAASKTLNVASASLIAVNDLVTVGTDHNNNFIQTKSGSTLGLRNTLSTTQASGAYVREAIVSTSNTFFNNREKRGGTGSSIRMLEVDVQGLLDCIQARKKGLDDVASANNEELNDQTDGGLVWFFTVDGPNANADPSNPPYTPNSYGVRLRNGSELKSTVAGAPAIKGLTVISDQAVYIQGNYNSTNKKPAAVMADTLNILSGNWLLLNDSNSQNSVTGGTRQPINTTVNAAFLSGTDITGGQEGAAGHDKGDSTFNGGLNNYPRLHEDWASGGGITLTYRGSYVTLGNPRRVNGSWCGTGNACNIYTAPKRDWDFDTDFTNAANLPPLTPRFVYLRQEVFSRSFDS